MVAIRGWNKLDPSRTRMLRLKMMREMRRRFLSIAKEIDEFIGKEDAFGLNEPVPFQLEGKQFYNIGQYRFLTDPQKTAQFRLWLQDKIDKNVLTTIGGTVGKPWTADYIETAWKKGMLRSYVDVNKDDVVKPLAWYEGNKEQFIREAFFQPETLTKVEILSTRAFENMKGLTDTMRTQLNRILSDGLVAGWNTKRVAREMRQRISSLTRTRAMAIARTEIVYAQAEGQLDGFKRLGVTEVTAAVEWSTAGDKLVCAECSSMEGMTFTLDEAHGLIPLHTNCLPGDSLVSPGGEISSVSKRWYDGEMFVISTSLGDKLTCTPNHPVLSNKGWVPANGFDVGSKVICNSISERERLSDRNDIDKPTRIEDIAESFFNELQVTSIPMPVSSKDFHGDGVGSEVAIVGTNGELTRSLYASFRKHLAQLYFVGRYMGRRFLDSIGAFTFGFDGVFTTPSCRVCGKNLMTPLGSGHSMPFNSFGLTSGAEFNSERQKPALNSSSAYLKLLRNGIYRNTIFVKIGNFVQRKRDKKLARNLLTRVGSTYALADVTHVKSFHYSGYVYNLETSESYYMANDITTHNCRCAWIPVI